MRKTAKPKDLVRILERLGFICTRQSGSHAFFKHNDGRWTYHTHAQ
jgi:predicted RNA binding protein YcfA (HicA-like mRNA interferase family)